MKCKYPSPIRLVGRDNGKTYYFLEGTVYLHVVPYRAAEEEPLDPGHTYIHGPRLGEWDGSLVVPYGANIHKHLDRYWWETDKHRGDIWLEKSDIRGDDVELWFRGSDDLISIELETELKKML